MRGKMFSLFGFPIKFFITLVVAVTALGFYIATLLFGPNSLGILISLKEQRETFEKEIENLKRENAALQKEYFELKQLEP